MRLLTINGIRVDIDDKTAIGIDLQTYDVKSPAKAKINISNTFSVPKTINNLSIFGLPDNPQSTSTKVYEVSICNYWLDNEKLIDEAKIRVEEIQDRINLLVFDKKDIWETLKTVEWQDFMNDFMFWMYANKGLYDVANPYTGTFDGFIDEFAASNEGVKLSMFWGNLFNQELSELDGKTVERDVYNAITGEVDFSAIYLYSRYYDPSTSTDFNDLKDSHGGHFSVFVKTIFEYIEDTYNVNFLTSGGVLPGNIWDDPVANQLYINSKDIGVLMSGSSPNYNIFFYKIGSAVDGSGQFLPYKKIYDKRDKTLYDFVVSFMQHLNLIKDELFISGENIIRLARFDDLKSIAVVEDFSGKINGSPKYKPKIDGYAQNNYIKFKSIYPEGDSLINSKNLTSQNANLNVKEDLFDIDAYIPAVLKSGDDSYLDLSTKEAFKTFTFMADSGLTSHNIVITWYSVGLVTGASYTTSLPLAEIYDLNSEYNFLDEIIDYPVWYEINKWLTISDIRNLEFFKQYYIRELNGSFFINKIKGFNPDKSKEPTEIELIKLGNRTPITPPDLNYWTDGVGDPFVDGTGDYFY
jgi:hypothetical protein